MRIRDWMRLSPELFRHLLSMPLSHMWYMAKCLRYENPRRHNGQVRINTFFPPIPSAAFDKFFNAVIKREWAPFSVYFAVTDRCPYKCPHCSYGLHTKGRMDTKSALDVIAQIKALGATIIGFTGGEPLLREDIVELVESVGDGSSSIIFTTGYHLDEQLCSEFFQAGLGCLAIGIESPDSGEHDETRGVEGSFQEALRAIQMSLEAGIYTAISTVATREKLLKGQLQELAELATKYGVNEFRILEPIPTGRFQGRQEEVLSIEETKRLADFHKQWNRRKKGPAVACFAYLESDEMFGCGAGFHHLFVDAVGNVCPCDLTPLSFGNVTEEPLSKIWAQMRQWFDKPRCGCFMKEICNKLGCGDRVVELPLSKNRSIELCNAHRRNGKLPKIYTNFIED
jgi:radical SAM protein with 4Fe4S-binding SPASM domain